MLYVGFLSYENSFVPTTFKLPTAEIIRIDLYSYDFLRRQVAVNAVRVGVYKSGFVDAVIIGLGGADREVTCITCYSRTYRYIAGALIVLFDIRERYRPVLFQIGVFEGTVRVHRHFAVKGIQEKLRYSADRAVALHFDFLVFIDI